MLRGVALGVTAVLAFGVTGAATAMARLQGNIDSAEIDHLLGERPPAPTPDPDDPNAGVPVNILVLGSDSREGDNDSVATDDVSGQRSDTTIVMHVSADRERVELVSIPRDSLVEIPSCLRSDGSSSEPRSMTMFNEAFGIGLESGEITDAAACTVKTVEANTGLFIDHFVVVDMAGFIDMVDALGGVPMCIPHDMYSEKAKLKLKAGERVLGGRTALAFARARTGEGLGDGSDTGRIGRQQELLAATAREVLGKNILTDVPELVRFLNATTRSLTVSSGIGSINDMAGLAYSMRTVRSDSIVFMTVPNVPWEVDPNRLVWSDKADEVWAAMRADTPITGEKEPAKPGATATPGSTPAPTQTKKPGVDAFTPDDTSSVCGDA